MARSFFQFLVLLMAAFCALSRVSDYKHHWSDVLVGTLLGSIIAVITVSQMINCSAYKTIKTKKIKM